MRQSSAGRPSAFFEILAFGIVLVLAPGCISTRGTQAPGVDPELLGGTLRLALIESPNRLQNPAFLDPARPYNTGFSIDPELMRCCLVRTLLSYNGRPTEEGGTELRPDLAAEMPSLSHDGLTWTFRLEPGLHYAPPLQDVEITAADVVRGIARTARVELSGGAYSTYLSVIEGYDPFAEGATDSISGLEVRGDHVLVVHLTEVANDLGYRVALPGTAPIPPSPRDPSAPFGAADGHDDGYGRYLVASGPYMVEGAEALDPSLPVAQQASVAGLSDRAITFVRNPSWRRSSDDLRGAYVDRIELRVMTRQRAESGIDDGTVDWIFDGLNSREQVARYRAHPAVASRVVQGSFDFFVGYTAMNVALPPFDDVHVRRAVNHAYDAARWTRVSNRALARIGSEFRFGRVGHLAPDGTEANLLRDTFTYAHDVEVAHREMAASRYDADGDGVCDDPACRSVSAIETGFNGFERFADRVWVDGLAEIGIGLDIRRIGGVDRYLELSNDPTRRFAINLGTFWFADYPNAAAMFETLFRGEGVGASVLGNVSLVGASPEQLRRWGYDVTSVPNVDREIRRCASHIGFAQTRCWAGLDQHLMSSVVPWVPQNTLRFEVVGSDRVVRSSLDQALGTWLALDQVAVRPDAP